MPQGFFFGFGGDDIEMDVDEDERPKRYAGTLEARDSALEPQLHSIKDLV